MYIYTYMYVCAHTVEAAAPTVFMVPRVEVIKTMTYLIPDN
jgi:hypothetical protein